MDQLTATRCVPCRGDVPPLDEARIRALQQQVPEWQVVPHEGVPRLTRGFKFPDFRSALDFTVEVGELAEREDHHPDIHLAWGRVKVEVWTHKIKGLHENDFVIAAKTDEIYKAARAG